MKAVYFNENGAVNVLQYGDLPDPLANADEVVVDVGATHGAGGVERPLGLTWCE